MSPEVLRRSMVRPDIFVRDLVAATTTRVSVSSTGAQADRASSLPSISSDGRFVSFLSDATTLVPGATGAVTFYVRDTQNVTTTRSVSSTAPLTRARLSGDGRYTVAASSAGVFIRDRFTATTSTPAGATTWRFPSISNNGRYVVAYDNSADGRVTIIPNPLAP